MTETLRHLPWYLFYHGGKSFNRCLHFKCNEIRNPCAHFAIVPHAVQEGKKKSHFIPSLCL